MPEYRMSYARATDANGIPLPGAKLYAYDAGTTTPKDTYSSYLLSTPNSNPVVADSGGLFGAVWQALEGRYKFVLKDADDNTIWTDDYVEDAGPAILTTRGDVLTYDATGYKRLALGAANKVLGSDGTDLAYLTVPLLDGANIWTAANVFEQTADNTNPGPIVTLRRIRTSAADNDGQGELLWVGRNDAGSDYSYAEIYVAALDVSAGAEQGTIGFGVSTAGVMEFGMVLANGLRVGSAAGGHMGTGTVNATAFYENGVAFPKVAAWGNIQADGTITDSYNVASIANNSTGQYTITFTNALADANYCVVGMGQDVSGVATVTMGLRNGDTKTTGAFGIRLSRVDTPTNCNFTFIVFD